MRATPVNLEAAEMLEEETEKEELPTKASTEATEFTEARLWAMNFSVQMK